MVFPAPVLFSILVMMDLLCPRRPSSKIPGDPSSLERNSRTVAQNHLYRRSISTAEEELGEWRRGPVTNKTFFLFSLDSLAAWRKSRSWGALPMISRGGPTDRETDLNWAGKRFRSRCVVTVADFLGFVL